MARQATEHELVEISAQADERLRESMAAWPSPSIWEYAAAAFRTVVGGVLGFLALAVVIVGLSLVAVLLFGDRGALGL